VDEYLNARRTGRGAALQASARRAVWTAFAKYQALLAEKGMLEWEDLPLLALKELDSRPLERPYGHVIVDEAQDLTVTELRLAQRLGGSTFLVGDMAQSIYTRGYSWKEAGLALQGRSFSMRRKLPQLPAGGAGGCRSHWTQRFPQGVGGLGRPRGDAPYRTVAHRDDR